MALIFDIKHFAIHDGDGIRTTIFFKGCPLRCKWCHNPESLEFSIEKFDTQRLFDGKLINITETVGREVTTQMLMQEIMKDKIFYNNSNGGGVTISGGEPLMQIDSLLELLAKCKENSIHTAVDTSGYTSKANFKKLLDSGCVDLILFDIKVIDQKLHQEVTQRDNALILENLELLRNTQIRTIIRVPMIPDISFTQQNIEQLIEFLDKIKSSNITEISLLPYHNTAKGKYSRFKYKYLMNEDLQSLNREDLECVKQILQSKDWKVSIG